MSGAVSGSGTVAAHVPPTPPPIRPALGSDADQRRMLGFAIRLLDHVVHYTPPEGGGAVIRSTMRDEQGRRYTRESYYPPGRIEHLLSRTFGPGGGMGRYVPFPLTDRENVERRAKYQGLLQEAHQKKRLYVSMPPGGPLETFG